MYASPSKAKLFQPLLLEDKSNIHQIQQYKLFGYNLHRIYILQCTREIIKMRKQNHVVHSTHTMKAIAS
jgi:hypothetical protein